MASDNDAVKSAQPIPQPIPQPQPQQETHRPAEQAASPQAPAPQVQPTVPVPPPTPRARVHLAIPVMDKVHVQFMNSMYRMITSTKTAAVSLYWNHQDSLVSRSRNVLFSDWLFRSQDEYFMFLDSDLEIVQCGAEMNLVDMLLEDMKRPEVDFVGGLYSVKAPGAGRSSSVAMDFGPVPAWNTGLHEMLWLSTGCWMMRRKVGEALVAAYPELIYDGDGGCAGKKMMALFQPFIAIIPKGSLPGADKEIRKYLSEDWAFCKLWKDIGGRIWNDSRIILKHWGSFPYSLYEPAAPPAPPAPPTAEAKK